MEHNVHNIRVGQRVMLDGTHPNGHEVVVVRFTPNQLFATIHSADEPGDEWQTMTCRLTPLEETKQEIKANTNK